jgi:outer membrane protein OmpA-like peptidoglycan-associated protein
MCWIKPIKPLACAALAPLWMGACTPEGTAPLLLAINSEAGAVIADRDFGQSVARNAAIQTSDPDFEAALTRRFAEDVPNTITFAFNSDTLDPAARAALKRQADWINQFPEVRFRVYGHTDAVGSDTYNQRLGLRRARAAVSFLIAQGISPDRLDAVASFGETQPVVPVQTQERRNRRTVTEVFGLVADHPNVLDGKYAQIIYRDYIASAAAVSTLTGITNQTESQNE